MVNPKSKIYTTQITNEKGHVVTSHPVTGSPFAEEPQPGSVVVTNGLLGTAYQRHFADGLWHRLGGGRPRHWAWMICQRNMWLVYDAPVRTEDPAETSLRYDLIELDDTPDYWQIKDFAHVHVRGKCIKNRAGFLCAPSGGVPDAEPQRP